MKFNTRDIGLAIRDHIEDHNVFHFDSEGEEKEGCTVDFVDVSDANNPVVILDNGQRFQIRIFAEG